MALPFGHNSQDKAKIASFFKDIDAADEELATLKSAYMTRCKRPRKKIHEALLSAKAAGTDMAAMRALIAERRDERRIKRRREELEPGEADAMDSIGAALGDFGSTELGKAAIGKARKDGKAAKGEAALDSLVT